MRIDSTLSANLVQTSQDLNAREASISQQLASGVRLSALSDDPLAVGRSATLSASLSQQDSFLTAASNVESRITTSDSALAAVVTQLTSAISLAVQGANDTETTANRQALASQLVGIRNSVLTLANSSYSGSYLFAGSKGNVAPFTLAADGSVTYNGDGNTTSVRTPAGGSIPASVSGSAIFTDSTAPVFAALQTAITSLSSGVGTDTASVSGLRDALNVVSVQRSTLDAGLNRLQSETSYTNTQQTNTKVDQSTLLASNNVSLATELQATESQQTALLSTLGKLNKTSLFDYL